MLVKHLQSYHFLQRDQLPFQFLRMQIYVIMQLWREHWMEAH